jgi:hypothetical protein
MAALGRIPSPLYSGERQGEGQFEKDEGRRKKDEAYVESVE